MCGQVARLFRFSSDGTPLVAATNVGMAQAEIARRGWAVNAADAMAMIGKSDVAFVDLRETSERRKHGVIPEKPPSPTPMLEEAMLETRRLMHENRLEGKDLDELAELEDDEDEEFLAQYR